MKEAIGNSFVMGMVIAFLTIFVLFFTSSIAYTKAFKAKNLIIEILEKHEDILKDEAINCSSGQDCYLSSDVEEDISEALGEMGYRISTDTTECEVDDRFQDSFPVGKSTTSNYEYCIYGNNTSKGTYYGVRTYIYFQVPIINADLKFPVYGETKINGILG